MQRIQAYKYELMPNGEQTRKMRQFAGACRFVNNKALALHDANCRRVPSSLPTQVCASI
jgi:putative transposase